MIGITPYRKWSVQKKLFVFLSFFILLSVSIVSFLSFLRYTSDFQQQSAKQVQQTIEQASLNVETYLDDLFRLTVAPYRNQAVMDALEQNVSASEVQQLMKRRLLENYLDEIMIYPRKDIMRVFILSDYIYLSGRLPVTIDPSVNFKELSWYKEAMKTNQPIFLPANQQKLVKNDNAEVFSIIKQLRSTRNFNKILGVMKVDANYQGIKNILEKVNLGNEGLFFIMDQQKKIIYSNSPNYKNMDFYTHLDIHNTPWFTTNDQHHKILVNSVFIPRANWTMVAVSSVKELNKNSIRTRNTAFILALLCSVLAIIPLAIFVRQFLKPLLYIVRLMKQVDNGRLDMRFPYQRYDEIGYLGTSFNALLDRINDMLGRNTKLVKEVYEAQLLQQEAQINALHSQIRPHFIFNTLNMISLLIQSDQKEKAVQHMNQLSSLLRSRTAWEKEVSVGRELELLKAYLSIQSSRYEERLDYEINIDNHLLDLPIPSLLIQTIVENSVVHGCETKRGKTTIKIYAEETDNNVVFYVEDNGKGMSEEELHKVKSKLEQEDSLPKELDSPSSQIKGAGIGLVNMNKRIKMMYGSGYGLEVNSILGEGTTVRIMLPKILQKEGDTHV